MPKCHNGWLSAALDSPAKLELLAFFYHNPYTVDSAIGLSVWLGLDLERVARAVEELAQAHLLIKLGDGEDAVFAFNNEDENVKQAVDRFIHTQYLPLGQRFQTLNDLLQGGNHSHD